METRIQELETQLDKLKTVIGEKRYRTILQLDVKEYEAKLITAIKESLNLSDTEFHRFIINTVYSYMQYRQVSIPDYIGELEDIDYNCRTLIEPEKTVDRYGDNVHNLFDSCKRHRAEYSRRVEYYFFYRKYEFYSPKCDKTWLYVIYRDLETGLYLYVELVDYYNFGSSHDPKDFYCYLSMEELLRVHGKTVLHGGQDLDTEFWRCQIK